MRNSFYDLRMGAEGNSHTTSHSENSTTGSPSGACMLPSSIGCQDQIVVHWLARWSI
ncbi:MAG: hypothetical protein HOC74_30175, partial [Gemmatimonadetes bacterium]|nr:hypothetical protein [Gemmatimonadota bacterium]